MDEYPEQQGVQNKLAVHNKRCQNKTKKLYPSINN